MLSRLLSQRDIELLDWAKRADLQVGDSVPLLEMIMPNGKKLGDCTGQECAELGKELAALGERMTTLTRTLSQTLRQLSA
jgi:hypothetical protein